MGEAENGITVTVTGGPLVSVPWTKGMTAQDALELAWNTINSAARFTYGLQYYGKTLVYTSS